MESDPEIPSSEGDDVASSAGDESFSDASSDINVSSRKRPIATKRPAPTASKRPRVTASKMPVASKRPAATKRPAMASKRPASKKMPSKKPISSLGSSDDEEDEKEYSDEEEEEEDEEEEEQDEEEDQDDDESDDSTPPSKRKKGGNTRSKFIDDAADVDLDADEEDDEEETGVKELEREMTRRNAEEREREAEKRRSALCLDPEAEAEEMRRLAKDVARRYGAEEIDEDEDDEELDDVFDDEDEDDFQRHRSAGPIQRRRSSAGQVVNPLPSIRDPKLWLLRCKPGTEQQVICDLMNRSYIRASTQDALFIKTAFTTNIGSGYFYVEAEKEVHVQKAIANVRFVNPRKITLVPIKEMVQAITIQKKKISVKRGEWVRLKRGIYKGDLAQVVATADQGTQVTLKIIPRIDYTKLGNDDKPASFTLKTRPAARLLNPAELREMGEYLERKQEPITGTTCIFFNNNFYKNGFLYKSMRISNVIVDGVGATLSEVEKFQQRIADSDDEADDQDESADLLEACRAVSAAAQEHGPRFAKGNSVQVFRGDLKHLTGVVISIVDDQVTMMPAHEDLHEPITFPQSDLKKYFKLGDHVKVIRGEYKDETGLIVRVEDDEDVIVVFSDISAREMRVFCADVIESSEVSSGRDTLGNYELHDLVSVRDSVGVIIKIEIGSVQILDTKGVVMTVRLQDIGRRRNNRASVALDANSRQLAAGDAVKVISNAGSHYSGVSGTVLHVFRSFVFVRSREVPDNGGIFVVRARSLSLVGEHQFYGDEHGRISATSVQKPGATVLPAFTRGRRPQSHPLLSETVVIKSGPHKGLLGIVKDASDSFVRVELHSISKTVNVPIGNVSIRNNNVSNTGQPMSFAGAQTPLIGSATPAWNAGARTPMHPGAMTPMHSSSTYSNDSAWNVNAPMTPIHTTTPSVTTPSATAWDDNGSGWGDSNSGWSQTPRTPSAVPTTAYSGSNWDAPVTPADPITPHTPATPFTSNPAVYTPEPHTPFTPMSGSYATPSTPIPATPTPFTPTSPAPMSAGAVANLIPEEWVEKGLEAVISNGISAVVMAVNNGFATLSSKTQTFDNVPIRDLTPSIPAKNERLKIISGENKGQAGILLGVDGTDGIVKTDLLDINIIEMSSLCRYPQN